MTQAVQLKLRDTHVFGGGPHVMGIINVTPDSFLRRREVF
jgi:dihydropteroate synthase